jgi:hypothetical protein
VMEPTAQACVRHASDFLLGRPGLLTVVGTLPATRSPLELSTEEVWPASREALAAQARRVAGRRGAADRKAAAQKAATKAPAAAKRQLESRRDARRGVAEHSCASEVRYCLRSASDSLRMSQAARLKLARITGGNRRTAALPLRDLRGDVTSQARQVPALARA